MSINIPFLFLKLNYHNKGSHIHLTRVRNILTILTEVLDNNFNAKKNIQTGTRSEHDGTIQYDPQEYMARELLFDFYSVSALVIHSSYT
jgi:hypothetical protein